MLISANDLVAIDGARAAVVADPFTYRRRSVVIDVAGVVGAVHFDNVEAAMWFARRYADLVVTGATPELHAFAMHDVDQGWLFWSPGRPVYQYPRPELGAFGVAFLTDAVALTAFVQDRTDGMISLHAATLGVPGGVAAVIADSNGGKTTTAVACARAGMDLYSDERCLIDRRTFVHAFRRAVNLRDGGLRLLVNDRVAGADPIGARLRAHGEGPWDDVRLSELAPLQRALEPRPLRAVFLLAGADPQPTLAPAPAMRAAMASACWAQGAGSGLDKIARLAGVFSQVPCYTLRLGTPDASARLIRQIVESHVVGLERTA